MNNYTVYMHIAPNNKKYIGITKQNVKRRWRGQGQGYKKNVLFYRAIKKYGWDNFEHKILFEHLTKESAEQKEIELINKYKSNNPKYGYNIENGGKTIGTVSESTKEKLRQANLGKKISEETRKKYCEAQQKIRKREKEQGIKRKTPSGKDNWFYGKHHTEETKQKIREKNSGINSAWWGRKHTKEEKEKIALAHKKIVEQLNSNQEVINTYPSVLDASISLNCNSNSIYKAIYRKAKSHNYYWRYKEV